jgi:hypothetical protein
MHCLLHILDCAIHKEKGFVVVVAIHKDKQSTNVKFQNKSFTWLLHEKGSLEQKCKIN